MRLPIRLGHESLDETLAYLKGKDAESEEVQERANSSLALFVTRFTPWLRCVNSSV